MKTSCYCVLSATATHDRHPSREELPPYTSATARMAHVQHRRRRKESSTNRTTRGNVSTYCLARPQILSVVHCALLPRSHVRRHEDGRTWQVCTHSTNHDYVAQATHQRTNVQRPGT